MKFILVAIFITLFFCLSKQEEEANKIVDNLIENNKLLIFSKTYCPFCKRVKALFSQIGVLEKAKVVELDTRDDAFEIQTEMAKRTGGKRSVPQVFINGEHIGGS